MFFVFFFYFFSFFFNATATTEIYTLSLHDALPILVFKDHHDYTQDDVELTQKHLLKSGAEYVVTTEKDMVKLYQLDLSRIEIYSIGIEFKLSKKAENRLIEIIKKSG